MKKKIIVIVICIIAAVAIGAAIFFVVNSNSEDEEADYNGAYEWGDPEDSNLYVEKVEGIGEDFITGADISSYLSEIESGVIYYDFDGNELDNQGFFDFLEQCGVNYVRIRVWNDPYDENGNGYGGGNNDLAKAIEMGQYTTNAGMKVLIDFHFSDFWADPAKQNVPKAWSDMTVAERTEAIAEYTTESLEALLDADVDVGMVQIGNETTGSGFCGTTDWEEMAAMFDAGCDAAHEVADSYDTEILTAIHFTNPESGSYATYAANLNTYDVSYDVFASSYYPYWHGTLLNLKSELSAIANKYDKKVMVAETSWAYTLEDGDGHSNTIGSEEDVGIDDYEISIQGQADVIRGIANVIAGINGGIGMFYWEPAWIPVQVYEGSDSEKMEILEQNRDIWETYGSGWASSFASDYDEDAASWYGGSAVDNQALFDFYGNPLESLNIYNYIRTGTNAPIVISSIKVDDVMFEYEEEITLPEKATVKYNNHTSTGVEVTWDEDALADAISSGAGTYTMTGTVNVDGTDYDVSCNLTINAENLISNYGFEEGDTAWTIETDYDDCVGIRMESNNLRTGEYCLHFWDDEDFSYTVYQTVSVSAGTYTLSAYVQGGDNAASDTFTLYAIVDGEEYSTDATLSGWQVFDNPEITDIVVPEATEITVGVKVTASSGAWGAWDDFSLIPVAE